MRGGSIHFFTDKEEEFVNLLIKIGFKKNVAKLLVFLAKTPEATSHVPEISTDMCQSEVNIAVKYLMDQGWIKDRESPSAKGHPHKTYSLAEPINEIISSIEKSKKNEANNQFELVRKMRDFV